MFESIIGYTLFYLRIKKDGKGVVWSTQILREVKGSFCTMRRFKGTQPGVDDVPEFTVPSDTAFTVDDLPALKQGRYDVLYCADDDSGFMTVPEAAALGLCKDPLAVAIQPPTQPVVTPQPIVEPPVVTAQ